MSETVRFESMSCLLGGAAYRVDLRVHEDNAWSVTPWRLERRGDSMGWLRVQTHEKAGKAVTHAFAVEAAKKAMQRVKSGLGGQ